jgi:hypothetical protein
LRTLVATPSTAVAAVRTSPGLISPTAGSPLSTV